MDDSEQVMSNRTEVPAEEKCLVRIQNYRDPVAVEEAAAQAQAQLNASTISKGDHSQNDGGSQSKLDGVSNSSSQRALK